MDKCHIGDHAAIENQEKVIALLQQQNADLEAEIEQLKGEEPIEDGCMTEKPSYREAVGAAPGFLGNEKPEDVIARARADDTWVKCQAVRIEDLEAEIKHLKELVLCKNELLMCYRIGKQPSERLWRQLDALRVFEQTLAQK